MIVCKQCNASLKLHSKDIMLAVCKFCGTTLNVKSENVIETITHSIVTSTPSFIKVEQKGILLSNRFEVVGRIIVWTEDAILSYWTLLFENGSTTILEEGYGNFGILEIVPQSETSISKKNKLWKKQPDQQFDLMQNIRLNVDLKSEVIYIQAEGQSSIHFTSPKAILYANNIYRINNFEIWSSEQEDLVFRLKGVNFEDLNFEGISIESELQFPQEQYCTCSKCKHEFKVLYFPYVQTTTCPKCPNTYCFDILKNSWVNVFSTSVKNGENASNELPVGAKIKLLGDEFEVIGKVYKRNQQAYEWTEYHLFHPQEGSFAYLSESQGHFILLYELFEPPKYTDDYRKNIRFFKKTFRSYDIYKSEIKGIMGNLAGAYPDPRKKVNAYDYVAPPYMLSLELGKDGANHWHFGEHIPHREIKKLWKGFNLTPPKQYGYGAVRPANKFSLTEILLVTALMAICFIGIQTWLMRQNHEYPILHQTADIDSFNKQLVFDDIQILDDLSELNIRTQTQLSDSWLVLNYTLINTANGNEAEGGQELSFYSGYADGEYWSEGSNIKHYKFSGLDRGQYKLIADVELNPESVAKGIYLNIALDANRHLGKNFWFPLLLIIGWAIFAVVKYFIVESYRVTQ